jgi:hypothetical protein
MLVQSAAGVAGEALFEPHPFGGVYPVEGAGSWAEFIPQSSRYNFCRCKNMSTLSSRQLTSSGFARNGTKAGGSNVGGEGIIELLGYYGSAFDAADSVYMQSTGWDGWDRRKRIDAPPTLLLWSKKLVK